MMISINNNTIKTYILYMLIYNRYIAYVVHFANNVFRKPRCIELNCKAIRYARLAQYVQGK